MRILVGAGEPIQKIQLSDWVIADGEERDLSLIGLSQAKLESVDRYVCFMANPFSGVMSGQARRHMAEASTGPYRLVSNHCFRLYLRYS